WGVSQWRAFDEGVQRAEHGAVVIAQRPHAARKLDAEIACFDRGKERDLDFEISDRAEKWRFWKPEDERTTAIVDAIRPCGITLAERRDATRPHADRVERAAYGRGDHRRGGDVGRPTGF